MKIQSTEKKGNGIGFDSQNSTMAKISNNFFFVRQSTIEEKYVTKRICDTFFFSEATSSSETTKIMQVKIINSKYEDEIKIPLI